jgi:hypothetical protein
MPLGSLEHVLQTLLCDGFAEGCKVHDEKGSTSGQGKTNLATGSRICKLAAMFFGLGDISY